MKNVLLMQGHFLLTFFYSKRLLDNCNSRKLAAKALQEQHSELHLANLIRKSGSIEAKGIVLSVLDRAVDVVLLFLGVIRRVYLDVFETFFFLFWSRIFD